MKIYTVAKQHAPNMNRKARRQLAKKIRKDLAREQAKTKKEKAIP